MADLTQSNPIELNDNPKNTLQTQTQTVDEIVHFICSSIVFCIE